ncbi:MAG: MFS transporter [Dehalococcoidales bacterium]|nr:MAG: MFS transporter [Dehalococcoidales bacterium]
MQNTRSSYKWLALLTVSIGTFMATLDASIVNISLPRLGVVFDTELSVVLWVTVAYLLVSVGLVLTLGKVGDLFGRKRIYVTGLAIFTVGLVLCWISQSVVQLILSRIVQGVGAAMTVALSNAIVTDVFPDQERGKALGILGAVVSAGLLSGPILGGPLLDALDWPSIFYVRVPVGIISVIMAFVLLKEQRSTDTSLKFDWGGAGTLFGGLACLLLFLNLGSKQGFTDIPILGMCAGAVVLLGLFIIIERRASQPILNLGLFRSRIFTSGIVSMGIMFLCISANTFLTPFYLIHGLGRSYAQSGPFFAVISSTTLIVGPVSGWLSDRIGSRILCTIGMTFVSLALFLLSRLGIESSTPEILLRFALLGFGLGMFSSPNNSSIMGSVPRESLSTGSAMIATVRQVGMSCGIAIAGAIFTWLTGDVPIKILPAPSIVNAFQDSLLIASIICSVAIIASWARGRRTPEALETIPSIG